MWITDSRLSTPIINEKQNNCNSSSGTLLKVTEFVVHFSVLYKGPEEINNYLSVKI